MSDKFWVLDGKTPKPATLHEWAEWFKNDKHRHVALTRIGNDFVSTVFLGIDHSWWGGSVPQLFETMIFVDGDEKWCERCATWEQAEEQHATAVTELKLWHENAKTVT
jgi:hypothetical protein